MTSFTLHSQIVDSSIVQHFQLPEVERSVYFDHFNPYVFVDQSSPIKNGVLTLSEFHSGVMMVIPLDQEPPYLPIFIDSSGLSRNGWNFSWSESNGRFYGTNSGRNNNYVEINEKLQRTERVQPNWLGDPHFSGYVDGHYFNSIVGQLYTEDNISYWSESLIKIDPTNDQYDVVLDSYSDLGLNSYNTDTRYCWIDEYTDSLNVDNTHGNSWSYNTIKGHTIVSMGYRHAGVGIKIDTSTYFVGGTQNLANMFSWKNSKGFTPPSRWATHSMKVQWVSSGLDSILLIGLRNANCEDSISRVDYVLLDLNGMKADIIQQFTPTELVFAQALGNVQLITSIPFENRSLKEVLGAPILVNFGEGPGARALGGHTRYGFYWDPVDNRPGLASQFMIVTPTGKGTWHASMLGYMAETGASYQIDHYSYAQNPRLKTFIEKLRTNAIQCIGENSFDLPNSDWEWGFNANNTSYNINPNTVYDDPVVLLALGKPYAGGSGYVTSHKLAVDCSATSADKIKDTVPISFYPNPTHDRIFIEGAVVKQVTIMSLMGDVVLRGDKNIVELSHLADGVYLLQVITTDGINTISKVLKER